MSCEHGNSGHWRMAGYKVTNTNVTPNQELRRYSKDDGIVSLKALDLKGDKGQGKDNIMTNEQMSIYCQCAIMVKRSIVILWLRSRGDFRSQKWLYWIKRKVCLPLTKANATGLEKRTTWGHVQWHGCESPSSACRLMAQSLGISSSQTHCSETAVIWVFTDFAAPLTNEKL